LKLIDCLHFSEWWMCVKKWEGVKSYDEYCESWANGGLNVLWIGKTMGGGYYIMERWTTQMCPTKGHNGNGGGGIIGGWWWQLKCSFGECFHSRVKEGRGTQTLC
jgi:hypothetical protein